MIIQTSNVFFLYINWNNKKKIRKIIYENHATGRQEGERKAVGYSRDYTYRKRK